VQNFTPVGPRISEISRGRKNKTSALKHKPAPQAIAYGRTNKRVFVISIKYNYNYSDDLVV